MGRPIELEGSLGELARAAGGTARLGELVGVEARTIQRWGNGGTVPRTTRLLLARLGAEYGLSVVHQKALAELNC
jgi:hypothetical protein